MPSPPSDVNSTDGDSRLNYTYRTVNVQPSDMYTHVLVDNPQSFVVIRGVQNRLIIMLPNDVHNLKVSRFFIILYGQAADTSGSLFFRQVGDVIFYVLQNNACSYD